ncbi:nuclear transport factor 2 family protein [Planococcus salinus]|nr:nuclear transport factor 2 family protein [Planococcus salinus]
MLRTEDFFRQVNEAFFSGDIDFMEDIVTDDIVWHMIGSAPIHGKQAFMDAAFGIGVYTEMDFQIDTVISNGMEAAVKGTMTMPNKSGDFQTYAFCDFYRMDRQSGGKIQEMISFVIELKQ